MKYSIVYSSNTGNTKMLADVIKGELKENECIYFGNPDDYALKADLIYIGFWTDKGCCDDKTAEFLKKLTNQQVFLFGTAGFGISKDYFEKVISRVKEKLNKDIVVVGSFMCQGKMPVSVRQRYEKMQKSGSTSFDIQPLIDNFDKALSHPDKIDIENLKKALTL